MTKETTLEDIISLCKRRGFIYQGSDIYGGLSGTWDYGPLGLMIKDQVKRIWWERFVDNRSDMYGVDAAILMNSKVWVASGHVGGFADPLVECLDCKKRFRVDQIVDENNYLEKINADFKEWKSATNFGEDLIDPTIPRDLKHDFANHSAQENVLKEINDARKFTGPHAQYYLNENIDCPNCKKRKWNEPRQFDMMFKTNIGAIESDENVVYLRPETAQGMFVNFKNIQDTFHPKLPFGMAQIGKAFRNEIAPRDFVFRVREFEQMEIEYFTNPKQADEAFSHFQKEIKEFIQDIGLDKDKLHELEIADEDRAHYSSRTIDFEYDFPIGRKELFGLANRTDFDLKAHSEGSKVDLSYFDEETKERFIPHCIEPSFGLDRTILAILSTAYATDNIGEEERIVLRLHKNIAPYRVAILPLVKNKEELVNKAKEIFEMVKNIATKNGIAKSKIVYDETQSIGKRYRRQDEIGTPICLTVDFDTLEKGTVTLRDRDSGKQEVVSIEDLENIFA
jgi:glycyl-tRNA synthetase